MELEQKAPAYDQVYCLSGRKIGVYGNFSSAEIQKFVCEVFQQADGKEEVKPKIIYCFQHQLRERLQERINSQIHLQIKTASTETGQDQRWIKKQPKSETSFFKQLKNIQTITGLQKLQEHKWYNHQQIITGFRVNRHIPQLHMQKYSMDLHKYIYTKSLHIDQKFEIALQVVRKLNLLHQKGLVHLDLKPQNIVINEVGQQKYDVRLIDFEESLRVGEQLPKGQGFSKAYASPEIIRFKISQSGKLLEMRAHPNMDIFSLGVILAQIFFRCKPFNFDPAVFKAHVFTKEVMACNLTGKYPFSIQQMPVYNGVRNLVAKCLSNQRPSCYQIQLCLKYLKAFQ